MVSEPAVPSVPPPSTVEPAVPALPPLAVSEVPPLPLLLPAAPLDDGTVPPVDGVPLLEPPTLTVTSGVEEQPLNAQSASVAATARVVNLPRPPRKNTPIIADILQAKA